MQSLILKGSRIGIQAVRVTVTRCCAQGPAPKGGGRSFFNTVSSNASRPVAGLNKKVKFNPFRTFSSGGGSGGAGGGGSGGGGGGGGGGGLWAAYLALLKENPLPTKAITAAILNGLGDVMAQLGFEDGPFNWKRLGIFTFLGLVLIGPALHFWYGSLSKIVTLTGTPGALCRLGLDQLAFAPVFIGSIIASIMFLEGKGDEAVPKLRSDLFSIVKSNWTLWVPFQFFNFRYVPVNLQVLAANVVALAWNTYMSYVSHKTA